MLYPNDSADAFVEPRCRIGWKGHDMTAKRNQFTFVTALIAFVIAVFPGWTAARGTSVEPRVLTGTARLSLPFVANDGELPWEVAFSTPNSHGTLFVTRDGALVHALTSGERSHADEKTNPQPLIGMPPPGTHAVRGGQESSNWSLVERFAGVKRTALTGAVPARTGITDLRMATPSRTRRAFEVIELKNAYDGIDIQLAARGGAIEKIFVVAPGADPDQIAVTVDGAVNLAAGRSGELIALTGLGPVVFTAPYAYQERDGIRSAVPVAYRVDEGGYAFVLGEYDRSLPLVIDPLVQATHLGAPTAPQDYGHSIALDPATGDVLLVGNTFSMTFPGTTGGAQPANAGNADYFVARLSGDLRALIQATYLGGTASETGAVIGAGALIAIDGTTGDVLIAGQTGSSTFPGTAGAAQPTGSGSDAFVARLSADLRTLRQATYVVGTGTVSITAIAIHPADGSLYVTGYTTAATLPGTSGGAQPASAGSEDGFVMRFNGALTSRLQTSYFGGSGADRAVALAIDPADGDVVVAGYTFSFDLPATAGRMQPAYGGTTDGFIARFDAGLTTVRGTTYVGGSAMDVLHTVVVDQTSGDVVAAGQTRSMDLPGAAGGAQGSPSGDLAFQTDGFLVRIDETLTTRIGATYFGGTGEDDVKALAVSDIDGELFATGITSSSNLLGRTGGAQASRAGGTDAFVARFSPSLSALRQSTYLGGSDTDAALSLAIHAASGDILIGGYTQSANFPGTAGGAQPTGSPAGFPDAFVARLTRDLSAIGPPASIVAQGGTPQSAMLGATFAQRLSALVRDGNLAPVPGVTVTFQLPTSGARAEFSETYLAAATTDAAGIATAPSMRAMFGVGSYTATATVAGVATPAFFDLTNTAGPPASVFTVGGTPQSTTASSAFPVVLQAKVTDSGANAVAGVAVTFTLPASGPTATFPGGVSLVVATTDSAGIATSPIVTAGAAAGTFDATATVSGVGSATFTLTVTAAADVRLIALEGGLQYAVIGQPYAQRIRIKAVTANGSPVVGHAIIVTFPASGASANFGGQASAVIETGADGIATSPEFTANGIAGAFDAMTDDGQSSSFDPVFRLTNTGVPATIWATGGSSQIAYIGERFARPLQATVVDGSGQAVPGATVVFDAPSIGPSARFPGGGTVTTAVTDSQGVATALGLIAGPTSGPYAVEAMAAGVSLPATFDLTNSADVYAIAVASGDAHACVLTFTGGVMCWGRNSQGQLGRGTIGGFDGTPQLVVGLASGIVEISAGAAHTCAITSNGAVMCWGANDVAQLGRSTASGNPDGSPAVVSGLSELVVAVSAGEGHTCVVTTTGAAKCWGSNSNGQLGRGTVGLPSAVPQDVAGLGADTIAIAAGAFHSCAATATGSVRCWGSNVSGQLGRGSAGGQDGTPQEVVLGAPGRSVYSGRLHSCALTGAGVLKCWGTNLYGELGRGSTGGLDGMPRDVVGLTTGVALSSLGRSHSCALMATGSPGGAVKCWGANFSAQLGRGTIGGQDGTPSDVVDLPLGASALAAGGSHTCALATGGRVACWGYNSEGQAGRGATGPEPASAPRDVRLPPEVTALSLGQSHACALRSQARVSCWGANYNGQTGQLNPELAVTGVPQDVSGLTGVRAVSGGGSHSCAVTSGGGVKCWGLNNSGQLGRGSTGGQDHVPQDVTGLASGVIVVSAGGYHTCVVTVTNGLKCWGDNSAGQLGRGTSGGIDGTPQDVPGLGSAVVGVSAGQLHTCAVMRDGHVVCWGDNAYGQLGLGSVGGQSAVPQPVVGLASGVIAVSAGGLHTCAVLVSGGVSCWGVNSVGTLGRGTIGGSDGSPQLVVGLANSALAVAAGFSHTCALTAAGAAKCWGNDGHGKLGRVAGGGNYSVPQDVAGLASGVVAIGVGIDSSCAVTRDGRVWCWGRNDTGMLGTGYAHMIARATDTVALQTSSQEISGSAGTPQTASTGATFPAPLSITPYDLEARTGSEGIPVQFTLLREGPTGAGGSFPGNAINVVVPVALGRAVSPLILANASSGSWKAIARASGGRSIAEFVLTNAAPSIATIGVVGGTPQSAVVSSPFTAPVVVRAQDAGGNPMAGVDVTLNAPASGASAAVLPATATTGADGRAQFDVGANAIGGAYALTASALAGAVQKRLPMLNVLGPPRMELGDAHSCMVTDTGAVKCWGRNVEGQLGRGAASAAEGPADVPGVAGAVAVAAGGYFSCALLGNGTVACWGDNAFGQTGQGGTGGIVPTASTIPGLGGVVAIATGTEFACALDNVGAVRCWGRNHVGQTGTGAATVGASIALPMAVPELASGVAALAAGGGRACAVMVGGNLKCWGGNAAGSLGLGTAGGYEPSPRDVPGLTEVATIGMGGEHTCVINSAGTLKCWGNNFSGQVGVVPIGSDVHSPVDVPDLLDDLVAVHLGSSFTCVLARDGYVKCWGANDRGQLGSGVASAPRAAKQPPIGLLQGVVSLATGFDHACARLASGGIECWGANTEGQANGGASDAHVPIFVGGLPGTPAALQYVSGSPQSTAVSSGFAQPLRVRVLDAVGAGVPDVLVMFGSGGTQANALLTPGSGGGSDGSVGQPTDAFGYAWVTAQANELPGNYLVTATITGYSTLGSTTFNLTNIGTPARMEIVSGGVQSASVGMPFAMPVRVRVLDGGGTGVAGAVVTVTAPAIGPSASFAPASATTDANGVAQIFATANSTPGAYQGFTSSGAAGVEVYLRNVLASGRTVVLGLAHACAMTAVGGVNCWGRNDEGQLGDGTMTHRLTPVSVSGLSSGVVALAAGDMHTCALLATGGVKCWGRNDVGQLGVGDQVRRSLPADVSGLSTDVVDTAAGADFTCAQVATGGLKCWGDNHLGALGDFTTTDRATPVDVTGLPGGVVSLTAGSNGACIVSGTDRPYCWGFNSIGQVGVGIGGIYMQPQLVPGLAAPILAIESPGSYACALVMSPDAFVVTTVCWGDGRYGQLGDGSFGGYTGTPGSRPSFWGTDKIAMGGGDYHSCMLTLVGGVECAGRNHRGQLGTGDTTDRATPAPVTALTTGVVSIARRGSSSTCVRMADGGVRCWGGNDYGQLGDGTTEDRHYPVSVQGFAGAPTSITAANGSGQSVSVSGAFANVQAAVTDSGGNAVQGATVTFTLPANGPSGSFGGQLTATAVTDGIGVATAPPLVANTMVGTWTATATVAGVAAPASFALTNMPGSPATLTLAGTAQTTLTTTLFPRTLDVAVTDVWGNAVPGVDVTFTLPPSGATGNFPGGVKTRVMATNASGVAATTVTANATAGSFNAQATVTGLPFYTFALTSVPRTGTTISVVSGDPQSATAGAAYAQPLVAVVRDSGGNGVPGLTVTFTLPSGTISGTFPGGVRTVTRITDGSGVATAPAITATTRSGTFVARASVVGVATTANFGLTNLADVPATIAARVGSQSTAVYTTFARALSVRVADAWNNPVPAQPVTFALPTSGATGAFQGASNPVIVTTDASGIATTALIDANGIVGTYQATASVAPIALPATFQLTNNVGAGAKFAIGAGTPQSVVVAQPFVPLAVSVLDASDRPVEGVRITFTLPGSAASATFPGGVRTDVKTTDVSGHATSEVPTATTRSGSFTATVRAAGIATVLNFALTNRPDVAATAIANGVGGQTATVFQQFAKAPSVRVRDQYGNGVPGIDVAFALPATGPAGSFADSSTSPRTVATDATGVATSPFVVANNTVGVWYVTATAGAIATPVTFRMTNVVGLTATVAAVPGSTPQATARGMLFANPLGVVVTDGLGHNIQGVSVRFTLPPGTASARFGPGFTSRTASVTTDANGVATTPAVKATATAGSYPATAIAAGVTGSVTFDLTNN